MPIGGPGSTPIYSLAVQKSQANRSIAGEEFLFEQGLAVQKSQANRSYP